jgi:hypothetical protein
MLVTPQKLVLQPGQTRNIRINMLAPRTESEQIYRIRVEPKENTVDIKSKNGKMKANVHIIIAYEVRARVAPLKAVSRMVLTRKDKTVTSENLGNMTSSLVVVKQCKNPEECIPLSNVSIYAGQKIELKLTEAWPVYTKFYNAMGLQKQAHSN